jgi:hypothetical protein
MVLDGQLAHIMITDESKSVNCVHFFANQVNFFSCPGGVA